MWAFSRCNAPAEEARRWRKEPRTEVKASHGAKRADRRDLKPFRERGLPDPVRASKANNQPSRTGEPPSEPTGPEEGAASKLGGRTALAIKDAA